MGMDRQTVIRRHRVPGRRLPWNAVLREYRNYLATISCRSRELRHGFPVLRVDGIAGSTPVRDVDRQTVLPLHRLPGCRSSRKAVVPEDSTTEAILSCRSKEPQHGCPVSLLPGETVVPRNRPTDIRSSRMPGMAPNREAGRRLNARWHTAQQPSGLTVKQHAGVPGSPGHSLTGGPDTFRHTRRVARPSSGFTGCQNGGHPGRPDHRKTVAVGPRHRAGPIHGSTV